MQPSAILFGSIGSITESSDLQRRAFNAAFAESGLDWDWDQDAYLSMLQDPGGKDRIARYARIKGVPVDPEALHVAKVRHFEALAREQGLQPRTGVVRLLTAAREAGLKTGFVTTTGPDTVALVLGALGDAIQPGDFDLILDATQVTQGKPDKEAYVTALDRLGIPAEAAIAIEDTPESAMSPLDAGIATVAFPGLAAQDRDFPEGALRLNALTTDLLNVDLGRGPSPQEALRRAALLPAA